jgi:hypothetical protein
VVGYTVTIEPLGVEVEVEEGQTILDASLRAGSLPAARLLPRAVRDVQGHRGRR